MNGSKRQIANEKEIEELEKDLKIIPTNKKIEILAFISGFHAGYGIGFGEGIIKANTTNEKSQAATA